MRRHTLAFSDVALLLVLGAALPVAVIDIMLGVYHLAVISAAAVAIGITVTTTRWLSTPVSAARPELELLNRVPAPLRPVSVEVVGMRGVCALGYHPGSIWTVEMDGRLSSPLCRPGAVALSPALQALERGEPKGEVYCLCPLGDRRVSFAVA